jgi:hypothetical protein
MAKFKQLAKLTQSIYGAKSKAAGFETRAKNTIVANIPNQSMIISTKAPRGLLNPKKINDHKMFRTSWTAKIQMATLTLFLFKPFFQTRKSAIPIRANNVVHTGPNTQFGGDNSGLITFAYHPLIAEEVKIEPITPAISAINTEIVSLKKLFW